MNQYLNHIVGTRGIEAAFQAALELLAQEKARMDEMWETRFYMKRLLDDGSMKLWPVSEGYISRTYDLQDCDGEPLPEFFWTDKKGALHRVTAGAQERLAGNDERSAHWAASDLIANGKIVGHILYTDH